MFSLVSGLCGTSLSSCAFLFPLNVDADGIFAAASCDTFQSSAPRTCYVVSVGVCALLLIFAFTFVTSISVCDGACV